MQTLFSSDSGISRLIGKALWTGRLWLQGSQGSLKGNTP